MSKTFNYIAATFIVFLLILWYWQYRHPPGQFQFPGEYMDKDFPVPIIAAAKDADVSDSTGCLSISVDCKVRTFSVKMDTTYFLTVIYSVSDTTQAVCMSCGTLYQGDVPLINLGTSCDLGRKKEVAVRLKPDVTYRVAVCLQQCSAVHVQDCGKNAIADAVISIRRIP